MVGAGGLGSNILKTLIQIGLQTDIVDGDIVDITNLNRQFFTLSDVNKPKAHAILKNVAPYAIRSMILRGYWVWFGEFASRHKQTHRYDIICCGVDHHRANAEVAAFAVEKGIPAVFVNVSENGDACRIFIQRPCEACYACYCPDSLNPPAVKPEGCPPTPAIADILLVACGFAVRAVVGELLDSPIGNDWNCRDITLSGLSIKKYIKKREGCPLGG